MKIINMTKGKIQIEFSVDELVMVNNALNETLNEIDLFEFQTRVGYTFEEVEVLLSEVNVYLTQFIDLTDNSSN